MKPPEHVTTDRFDQEVRAAIARSIRDRVRVPTIAEIAEQLSTDAPDPHDQGAGGHQDHDPESQTGGARRKIGCSGRCCCGVNVLTRSPVLIG